MKLKFQINKIYVIHHREQYNDHKKVGHTIYYQGDIHIICVFQEHGYNEQGEYRQIYFKELI